MTAHDYLAPARAFLWGRSYRLPAGCTAVNGSAFRAGFYGIRKNGLLVTTDYNRVDVFVIVPADGRLILGCQDSCAHGNPMPKPAEGVMLINVSDEAGPWWENLDRLFAELAKAHRDYMEMEATETNARREASRAMRRDELALARSQFTSEESQP